MSIHQTEAVSEPLLPFTPALRPRELAKEMSFFELDESLCLLLDSAWEAAEENHGEILPELQQALLSYCEAFGEKVDNIARYIHAQEAVITIARTEAERYTLKKARAENVIERLKGLLKYFMESRNIRAMKGRLHTISLRKNSQDSLFLSDPAALSAEYRKVALSLNCAELIDLMSRLPAGHQLRERLERLLKDGTDQPDNPAIRSALERGLVIEGAELRRGEHVRLT